MTNYKVQIYCNGSKKLGFGHISRSMALYKYLNSKDINTSIFGLSDEANNIIIIKSNKNLSADTYIIDSSGSEINSLICKLKKNNKTVITLDWFGDEKPNINIVIYAHHNVEALNKTYIGFQYVIIKNELLRLKKSIKKNNSAIVCIGGGDILSEAETAAEILHNKGYDVTLVKGPTSNNKKHNFINTVFSPKNFSEILASSKIVVTNGGGTMFESIFLKNITIALPQTEFETRIAEHALNNSSILGIGLNFMSDLNEKKIENFMFPEKNIIDGKGTERIYEIIKTNRI